MNGSIRCCYLGTEWISQPAINNRTYSELTRQEKHPDLTNSGTALGRVTSIEIKRHDQTSKANIKVCSTAAATVSNIPNTKGKEAKEKNVNQTTRKPIQPDYVGNKTRTHSHQYVQHSHSIVINTITNYKRNPHSFELRTAVARPGSNKNGQHYSVIPTERFSIIGQ